MSKSETLSETKPYTVKILRLLEEGITTAPQIQNLSGISKATTWRHLQKLVKQGLAQKIGKSPVLYSATGMGRIRLHRLLDKKTKTSNVSLFSSRYGKKNQRFHDLTFKFPILKFKPAAGFKWSKVNKEFKNSNQNFLFLHDFEVTLRKTSKHIIVYLWKKQFSSAFFFTEALEWVLRTLYLVKAFLRQRGIFLDEVEIRTIQQHIASPSPGFEDKIDSKTTAEVELGRRARSFAPTDLRAKAWWDYSFGPETESNDLLYLEKKLLVPEKVFEIDDRLSVFGKYLDAYAESLEKHDVSLGVYDKNIDLHLKVLTKIGKAVAGLDRSNKRIARALEAKS